MLGSSPPILRFLGVVLLGRHARSEPLCAVGGELDVAEAALGFVGAGSAVRVDHAALISALMWNFRR